MADGVHLACEPVISRVAQAANDGCDRSPVMVRMRPVSDVRIGSDVGTATKQTIVALDVSSSSASIADPRNPVAPVRRIVRAFRNPVSRCTLSLAGRMSSGSAASATIWSNGSSAVRASPTPSRASRAASDRASVQPTSTSAGNVAPQLVLERSGELDRGERIEAEPARTVCRGRRPQGDCGPPGGHEGIESPQRRSWPREWS